MLKCFPPPPSDGSRREGVSHPTPPNSSTLFKFGGFGKGLIAGAWGRRPRYSRLSSMAFIFVSSTRALKGLLRTWVRGLRGSSPRAALWA